MIVTPDMIAAAGRAAAAKGLPGIPPYIVEAMLRAAVDPPKRDELPPVPLGVPTVLRGVATVEPAEVTVDKDSTEDVDLLAALAEGRAIRMVETSGTGERRRITFWRALVRRVIDATATYELEQIR